MNRFNNSPCGPVHHCFCRKLNCAPAAFGGGDAFEKYLSLQKTRNLGYSEKKKKKKRVFPHLNEIMRCFSAFAFFIGKTYMLQHRNLSKNLFCHVLLDFNKRLKIDRFERCVSEHFPNAYGGIHMKFLNLELFISKAFTFSYIFFLLLCFLGCPEFRPCPPSL